MEKNILKVSDAVKGLYQEKGMGGLRRLSLELYGVETKHSTLSEYFNSFKENHESKLSEQTIIEIQKDIIVFALKNIDRFQDEKTKSMIKEFEVIAKFRTLTQEKSLYLRWLDSKASELMKKSMGDKNRNLGAVALGSIGALIAGPIGIAVGAVVMGGILGAAGQIFNEQKIKEQVGNFKNHFNDSMDDYRKKLIASIDIVQKENTKIENEVRALYEKLLKDIDLMNIPPHDKEETKKEFEKLFHDIPTLQNLFLIPSERNGSEGEITQVVDEIFKHITQSQIKKVE